MQKLTPFCCHLGTNCLEVTLPWWFQSRFAYMDKEKGMVKNIWESGPNFSLVIPTCQISINF
jgi:hypothetical protein